MTSNIKRLEGAAHPFLRFVAVNEQYGRHIIEHFAKKIDFVRVCDLGVGSGNDSLTLKKVRPDIEMYGVDSSGRLKDELLSKNINLQVKNIEHEKLDFSDESLDVFIAQPSLFKFLFV